MHKSWPGFIENNYIDKNNTECYIKRWIVYTNRWNDYSKDNGNEIQNNDCEGDYQSIAQVIGKVKFT